MLKRCLQGMAAVAMLLTSSPAMAQPTTAGDAPVYLNGDILVRFRTWSSGFAPHERADLFEKRLRHLLNGAEVSPAGVRLLTIKGQPTVVVGDQTMVTVTSADGRANRTTSRRLAQAWRSNLEAAIRKYNRTWDDGHRTVVIDRIPPAHTSITTLSTPVPEHEPASRTVPLATESGATEVILNGVKILRFRTSAGGFTPHERYVAFEQNLQAALRPNPTAGDVRVVTEHGLPALYLGRQYLCTVTEADAQANGSSPRVLAGVWANNLRHAVGRIDRN